MTLELTLHRQLCRVTHFVSVEPSFSSYNMAMHSYLNAASDLCNKIISHQSIFTDRQNLLVHNVHFLLPVYCLWAQLEHSVALF